MIGQIVAHADPVIRDWELWNEPDSGQFFHGTPSQYAWMLRTAHDAIKQVDPQAQVLLGGISGTAGSTWLSQVLAVPGADAVDLATPTPGALAIEHDGCSGLILEPDEPCSVKVRFTASAAGSVSGTLELASDQGALTIPVSATSPSVALLGASSPVRPRGEADGVGHLQQLTVTVSNPLAGPVHVASAQVSGRSFSIAADSCAQVSLAPRARCALIVRWRPRSPGTGHGTLTLRGDGRPLVVALRPTAFVLPVVTALALAGGGDCLGRRSGVAEASIDQPATLSWTLRRAPHAVDARCGPAQAGISAPARLARSTRSLLRLRGRRAPGTYRLRVTARNAHGLGRSRTRWLTVA